MTLWTLCGVGANALYATACVPMAWKTWRAGKDIGNPLVTMWTFFIANLLFTAYGIGSFGGEWPFTLLLVEVICWGVALFYHYWPRVVPVRSTDASGGMALSLHLCTRPSPHEGPCNGLPRHECGSKWINRPGQ